MYSSCQSPKEDEWQDWWNKLNLRQKLTEMERWLNCSCDACSLFREIVGEARIRAVIEKIRAKLN